MKRIISNVMLVAAAAMAFFACQKPEVIVPEFEEVNGLAFSSEKPSFDDETKTEWTGEFIQWSAGDKIRVAYTCDGVWQNADGTSKSSEENGSKTAKIYESKAITEAGSTAFFSVPGYFKGTAEGVYEFYGIYPSSLVSGADIKYAPSVTITIPTTQTPTASSFDSAADVMASKSQSYVGIPKEGENNGPISLKWERLVAHGHFTLKNLAVEGEEDIQTITLTANADADMVGTHYLYLDTYNVVKPNSNAAPNSITIDARNLSIDSEGNVIFWTCFLPCTWNSISVSVETDKATYTLERDLVALNKTKTFAKNARNVLAINMTEANRAVKNASSLPFVQDFSEMTGQSEITELEGFSSIGGKVYNAAGAIRLASGNADGSITTQLLDLSQNFHVKVTASGWDDNELALIVSTSEPSHTETVTLTAFGGGENFAEHIINFQPVSNSASLTFTAKEDVRCYIKKIEILDGHAVAVPVLKATAPNEIAAAGGEGSFNFTLANPQDGQSVSAESNVDWITGPSVNGNTVTYTVAENTSEEPREGTITLSYEGAESVDVTITQAAKPAEGVDGTPAFVKVTSAPSDWSGTYLIVFESLNKCWDGSLKGGTSSGQFGHTAGAKSITIANNTIEKNDSYFTIVKSGTNYIITSASGDVIGNSGTSAGLKIGSYICTITLNNDNTVNILASDGNTQVLYNTYANYIRFYKTSNVTSSSYGKPSLYKLENVNEGGETPEQPTLTSRNLAFSSTTATAIVGQAFTAPTLSGETVGVKYSSSNTGVATVDETAGVVTLVGAGTTTITATAPATDQYEAGEASYTLTVSAAQGGDTAETSYVKVTATPSDWSGTYLIVYESGATAYVYNGTDSGAMNYVSATISDNHIARSSAVDAVAVQIAKSGSGYSIKVPNGKYISGGTSNGTTFNTSAVANTITLNTNGTVKINNNTTTSFQFNSASDQMRFRYFKSAQKSVYLYKLN